MPKIFKSKSKFTIMNYKKHCIELMKEIGILLGMLTLVCFPFVLYMFIAYLVQVLTL